jgi:hypothetical protein
MGVRPFRMGVAFGVVIGLAPKSKIKLTFRGAVYDGITHWYGIDGRDQRDCMNSAASDQSAQSPHRLNEVHAPSSAVVRFD